MTSRAPILPLVIVAALSATAAGQAPDRSKAPVPGPPPAFTAPPLLKRTLSNGVPVWIVERQEVPVVQVNLVIRGGAGEDPPGKPGAASLTSAMLDEGAGARSALEIAEAIELLGADLNTNASMDASAVRLHVAADRLGPALAVMADVVLRPTFPAADLERLRRQRITALEQARDDAGAIADTAFLRVVFGPVHRYGTPEVGTIASLGALTASDLRDLHRRVYRPDRSVLIVVGNVTPAALLPVLEGAFGGWTGSGEAGSAARMPDAPRAARREIVLVDKPGAAQSEIRIGRVGVARSTPDYFPITVLNTILGGSFTSRLNQNLREKHGYSYGAYSGFVMRTAPGFFIAGAAVQTDRTAEAVREFFSEFSGMRRPIPSEEVVKARNYVALRFPGQLMTTRQIADRLEDVVVYGLPDDYHSTYIARVQSVMPEDVAGAATRHIDPGRLSVVVVGDRKSVEAGLRALGLGPVRVSTIDEYMGTPE
jgi:predicted Zn-dependent peptidase